MAGMELGERGGSAEEGSAGVLRHGEEVTAFKYLTPSWLRTFTRHNWKLR